MNEITTTIFQPDGPPEPVLTVPEKPEGAYFDFPPGSEESIYRRYAAGMMSILDRADLAVNWTVERVQARHYRDEDLEVRFEAGDLLPGRDGRDNAVDQRLATVSGVVAWHRTGGNNLTDSPLYVEEWVLVRVLSRTGEDETTFRVRARELAQIKDRVRDVILRDHLVGITRDANAWRWEDDHAD